ncbi:RTA1-domain-containing protein [Auriculariales sp. MPI-PUGE-AT-0066]|nr:RTA1-domain-containing protein [Auriculariales sp. MPI-PUGE-AT-0066]
MPLRRPAVPVTGEDTPYHYFLDEPVTIVFIVLFGISTALHVGQAAWFRTWFMLATAALCGIGEVIGWSARLWSSINPAARTPFLMQISSLIIAPTFFLAANFIILGRIVRIVGPQYSRLKPAFYSYIFLSADLSSLIVQAIGGGRASSADTSEGAEKGAQIMLGGIGLQFAALVLYILFACEFLVRVILDRPVRDKETSLGPRLDGRIRMMLVGLCISAVFLFIRTIYRTIELQDGWSGKIISNQLLFDTLDGMPITVAMFALNAFHPGLLVYNKDRPDPELQEKAASKETSFSHHSTVDTAV